MIHERSLLRGRTVTALVMATLAFLSTTMACAPDVGIEGEGPKPVNRRRRTTESTLPAEASDAGATTPDAGPAAAPACLLATPFAPRTSSPPAPVQAGACTAAQIDALAEACANALVSPECDAARGEASACAACVFGQSSEPTWRVIVVDPAGVHFNQAGCVEHVTKQPGCGSQYMNIIGCYVHHCGACGEADIRACVDFTAHDQCSAHFVSSSCAEAIEGNQAAVDGCFPPSSTPEGTTALFVRMATLQCPP